jgi:DNA-binding response OmpR family regulator
MSLNVLLIEDDLDLAQTVIDYFSLENILCDHASNGVSGLALLKEQRYDVLLLDLNLPRLDGIAVCQHLREQGDDLPVLMLTARDQLQNKIEGFEAGTDDYLVKPFELEELLVRTHALSKRRSGQIQQLLYADIEMNLKTKTASRKGQTLKLSPTGWVLLETLLRAAPEPVSRNKLEQAVWGEDMPDSNSLKVHLFHLRKAVDAPFATPLIHTMSGHGFAIKNENETAQS